MADSQDITTSSKSPAFQFYPKDYLSDAKTRAMTFKQRGMYWDLVSHCWLEGGLPSDPKEIARILGISTPARFEKCDWPTISRCFRQVDGGHQHPRLEVERRKQAEHREGRSEAGKRGADKRWHSHGSAIVEPLAKNASSSPISDLHSPKEQERACEPFDSFEPELPSGHPDARAHDFIERYKSLHLRLRFGAHYLGNPVRDFAEARQLVAVYDDTRLDKLAFVWLNTDLDFAQNGTRTIAKFRSQASWCEEQLIAWEKQHGPLTVAVAS